MTGKNNQNNNNGGGQRQKVTVSGIPPMVEQNFADTHPGYQTNFEGMQQPNGWTPQGKAVVGGGAPMAQPMDFFGQGGGIQGKFDVNPAPQKVTRDSGPAQPPYMGDAAENTPQPQSSFEGFQAPQFRPDVQPQQQGSLASLSQALANAGGSAPQFQADPNQRDGGFFGWLGGILPKNRRGIRQGETPEEYDARMTRNSKMYFTLADAIRHFGNIVNTSQYAPLQQFNDPNAMIEQGYQQRRAERQQRAAQEADAAYKQANMDLKRQKADADTAYKALLLDLNKDRLGLNKEQQDWRKGKDERDYNHKLEREKASDDFKEKKFEADQQQRATSNSLRAQSIAKRGSGGGRGGGSTPKYVTYDAEGKPHYAWNQTMWEQDQAYYNGNTSGKSSTSNSKEVLNKDGSSTRVTNRQGGSSVAQRAGLQRRQREQAKQSGKGAQSTPKGKGKLGEKKYH